MSRKVFCMSERIYVSYMKKSFKIKLMRNLEPLGSQTQKISWRDDDGVINKRNICETWLHNNWFHIWWTFTKQKRFSFSISVEQTQAVHKKQSSMTETFYNLLGIFLPQFLGLSWLHVPCSCAVESSMIYLSVVLLPDKIPHYSKQQTYRM